MSANWFIYDAGRTVAGPLSTEEVKADLETGKLKPSFQIWCRGQKGWIAIGEWLENLSKILDHLEQRTKNLNWFAERKGERIGPMTKEDLVQFLKNLSQLENVRLWRKGFQSWTTPFEVDEIVDALGITRRTTPRIPAAGSVTISCGDRVYHGDLCEIGTGGVGVRGLDQDLEENLVVGLKIESPNLNKAIKTMGKVMYIRDNGLCGLKFNSLSTEAKSIILEMIKEYKDNETEPLHEEETLAAA